jgi:hypothetical protein
MREVAVLVLLKGMIYDVHRWDGLRWHDIHIPGVMKIGTGFQAVLMALMLVLLKERNYEVRS